MAQEGRADPDQVLRILPVERHARTDAGMAEEEVAERGRTRQAGQEGEMRLRDRTRKRLPAGFGGRCGGKVDMRAVGARGVVAAEAAEHLGAVAMREEVEQGGVVIAREREDARLRGGPRRQEFDDPGRIGAAVDIVPEMDDAPVGDAVACDLPGNRLVHRRKQVEPPVDVADRIEPDAFGASRIEEMHARQCRAPVSRVGPSCRRVRRQPSTTMMCNARGPWAPSSSFCSMSPEREGPVMKFTVRGISPLP